MRNISTFSGAVLTAAVMLVAGTELVQATPLSGSWRLQNPGRWVTIGHNRGGYVVDFALQLEKWKESGTKVRFAGRCQSACTLYLALPASQTCLAPGASFTFHAPSGPSRSANRFAAIYMNRTYPGWVRSWINTRGGLTPRAVTMSYGYASKFMPTCKTVTAARKAPRIGQAG